MKTMQVRELQPGDVLADGRVVQATAFGLSTHDPSFSVWFTDDSHAVWFSSRTLVDVREHDDAV